tara:strand:- start:2307 stop:3590 length:1284 start_codon:yes stop_codon:yes gene_type:complete
MKSNYKKLGQFIQDVSVKNKNLNVELLLGVSITKRFIPSIANTIGTDMSKYKIVKKDQFAYGPVTSRNGEKISIALLAEDECLVSTSYTVFEIVDKEQLDPEYLMMWFRRSEFDRYARYMSHGTVRELFGWEEMCDIELPIPCIEKQREIVREYNVVNNRIVLNEQLTQKLEDTAQAIYKHWFIDFNFPISKEYAQSVSKPELEGQPYKSSGGKMVYCEDLEREIPLQWSFGQFSQLIKIQNGYAFKSSEFSSVGTKYIIKIKNIVPPIISLTGASSYNLELNSKLDKYIVTSGETLISMTGSTANQMNSAVGQVGRYLLDDSSLMNQRVGKLVILEDWISSEFCYQFISDINTHLQLLSGSTGSANQANISPSQIEALELVLPSTEVMARYTEISIPVLKSLALLYKENLKLEDLQDIINIRMSKG